MTALARLALLLGLRAAPTAPAAPIVHRGEPELCAGTALIGAPASPRAKLSRDEAERLLGIPVRVHGR